MKVAIFGQYYQNDTRPIIRNIFLFFNNNNVELVIEESFLKILYEHQIVKKEYKTFNCQVCNKEYKTVYKKWSQNYARTHMHAHSTAPYWLILLFVPY